MQRMNENSRLPGRRRGGGGRVSRTLAVPETSYFQVQIALNPLSSPTARRAGENRGVFLNPPEPADLSSPPFPTGPGPILQELLWAGGLSPPPLPWVPWARLPLPAPLFPRSRLGQSPGGGDGSIPRAPHPALAVPAPPPPPRPLLPLVPAPPSPPHFPAATRLRRGVSRVGTAGTGARTQAAASRRAAGGPRLGQARAFPRRARLRRLGRDCQVCAWRRRRRRRRAGEAALCPASRGRGARVRACAPR